MAKSMTLLLQSHLEPHQIKQLVAMYQDEWWTKGRSLPEVESMLRGTDHLFAYVDTLGNLAGFARVLTDSVYKAFLFDVIVRPDCRGTGLGARIVRDVAAHPTLSSVASIELYCRPELVPFYEAFGFTADLGDIKLMRRKRS